MERREHYWVINSSMIPLLAKWHKQTNKQMNAHWMELIESHLIDSNKNSIFFSSPLDWYMIANEFLSSFRTQAIPFDISE